MFVIFTNFKNILNFNQYCYLFQSHVIKIELSVIFAVTIVMFYFDLHLHLLFNMIIINFIDKFIMSAVAASDLILLLYYLMLTRFLDLPFYQ